MSTLNTLSIRVRQVIRRAKKNPDLVILGTHKLDQNLGFKNPAGLTQPMNAEFKDDLGANYPLQAGELAKCVWVDDITVLIWKKIP